MSKLTKNFGFMLSIFFILPNILFAADSGHGSGGIMSPDPGLMFWTIVCFVIVLIVLRSTAWKPLIEGLEKRENTIKNAIDDAIAKQKEAEELLKQYQEKLSEAEQEMKNIIAAGKKSAEELKKKMLDDTTKECENIKSRTQNELELAKQQAIQEVFKTAAQLSVAISTKIIEKSLDEKEQNRIIEDTIKQFQSSQILN